MSDQPIEPTKEEIAKFPQAEGEIPVAEDQTVEPTADEKKDEPKKDEGEKN